MASLEDTNVSTTTTTTTTTTTSTAQRGKAIEKGLYGEAPTIDTHLLLCLWTAFGLLKAHLEAEVSSLKKDIRVLRLEQRDERRQAWENNTEVRRSMPCSSITLRCGASE